MFIVTRQMMLAMASNTSNAPSGYIDPNFPNPHGPNDARIIIYGYLPSTTLCILALALFSAALLIHAYRLIAHRAWAYCTFAFACVMELVGYAFRYASAHVDPYRITFFIVSYFFTVVAPVFISAGLYVCLSQLVAWGLAHGLRLPRFLKPVPLIWTFVACDTVATVAQVTGAALIGHAESQRKDPSTPNHILLAGLAFQCAAFLLYLSLLGIFTHTALRSSTLRTPIRGFMAALWTASLLILMRTTYRLAETAQGVFGYAMTHEVFFGVFEFAPVVVAMGVLAVWFPAVWIGEKSSSGLVEKGPQDEED